MKRSLFVILTLAFVLIFSSLAAARDKDPLSSWNKGETKQSIVEFVDRVTEKGSSDFVPPAERIAVFDNDGTLWSEQPMYFQYFFSIDRVKALAPKHPEWKTKEPFASILRGRVKQAFNSGRKATSEILLKTASGMSTEKFEQIVQEWIRTAEHPDSGRHFTEMVYQPMLELLSFLRANDFKTFIVSGGGLVFMRQWTEEIYGIPPEQVVGTSLKTKFEMKNGRTALLRLPEFHFLNNGESKPKGINLHIGRRPIAAFGNSDGDLEMLEYTDCGKEPRLIVYVHHTDSSREWAYDRDSRIGRLDKGLDRAREKGWILVDMNKDWKVIYPYNKK